MSKNMDMPTRPSFVRSCVFLAQLLHPMLQAARRYDRGKWSAEPIAVPDPHGDRVRGQRSPTNAFVRPVQSLGEQDLVAGSIAGINRYWIKLTSGFGTDGIVANPCWTTRDEQLDSLKDSRVDTVEKLVHKIMDVARFENEGGTS